MTKIKMEIEVKRMEREEHHGDWHDAPLRWEVLGPGKERQIFHTKKNALTYMSCRKKAKDFAEASKLYINK